MQFYTQSLYLPHFITLAGPHSLQSLERLKVTRDAAGDDAAQNTGDENQVQSTADPVKLRELWIAYAIGSGAWA